MSYHKHESYYSAFWCVHPEEETETRENAIFELRKAGGHLIAQFPAEQLRDDLDGCLEVVREKDKPSAENPELIDELKGYICWFLEDVEKEYS